MIDEPSPRHRERLQRLLDRRLQACMDRPDTGNELAARISRELWSICRRKAESRALCRAYRALQHLPG